MPGGGRTNARYFGSGLDLARDLDLGVVQLLHDPQTSGGLLAVIDARRAEEALARLRDAGVPVARIGRVLEPSGHRVAFR